MTTVIPVKCLWLWVPFQIIQDIRVPSHFESVKGLLFKKVVKAEFMNIKVTNSCAL